MTADALDRIYATITAALGRPFPAEHPPTRQELLNIAATCTAAAQLAEGLADEVERLDPGVKPS